MGRGQELLDAARKGDVRTVTKILTLITKRSGPFTSLRRGAGVNVQDDNGYTPLHHACMNGHREIVHLLLKVDASPCVVDKKGATPLHLAAWKGDSHVVSMLLGHCNPPVNIDQKTNDQETALLIAAQFGHVDVVSQLIAKGADVSLKNNKEESPLDLASQYGKLETVMQLISAQPQLLEPYRRPISRGRSFPTTPLHRATMNGHKEVVAYLIDAGMDPNVRTENGTALHEGIRYLQASVVKVLLAKGADLKAKDRMGHSVHALLATYPEDATKRVKKYIREFENQIKVSYESEEDLPPIPNDYPSPVGGYVNAHGMKAPETQKNTNINLSLSQSSSSLTKNHQSFVKKLASKCLGLKAKFNSAPNISNSIALDSDVSAKSPNPDHKSNTNTLLIGNSKFFNKILSKKEESGEINCNDEFDTISLDRLGTLNRDSAVNRSNRSCPGFKTSLPNISENAELSDSDSVIITEIDSNIPKSQPKEAINLHTKLAIFEPRQGTISYSNDSDTNNDSADLVNECYESCKFSDSEADSKVENNNNLPKPSPRVNVAMHTSEENMIYENVSLINKRILPQPAVRNIVPQKILLDEVQRKALYENISVIKEKIQDDSPTEINIPFKEKDVTSNLEKTTLSRSSTMSSDSMEDETNLEDILLSEKSKSFRRVKKMTSSKSLISRTQSDASNVSEFTEASAIENVDCSEDIYTTMSGTLPLKSRKDSENKKKVLFRHKTFTNIEVDRNSINYATPPLDHYEFMKETLANYHIRGTGHCIHKAPTVEEFIYIFNRDTLYSDTPPFTLVPNNNRESYFETAICFCKPKVPKYHKSAEDLFQLPFDVAEENKVTIDLRALRARTEIVSTSFRCFCDSGQCTFHAKKRESPHDLIVKFSAIKKSISTPDITLDTSFSTVNRSSSMKNPSTFNKEIHYAVTNIEDIVLRNKGLETVKPESPIYTVMSQPSTLSSSSSQYSIKDIADVISLNSHSESTDAVPICALNSAHIPLRKSTSSEYSDRWTLASSNSNTTIQSDTSFKTCIEEPEDDSDDGTLHSGEDSSDAETVKSDVTEVSTAKRPWVHSDSFNFGKSGPTVKNYAILEEDSNSSSDSLNKFESPSKIESGISVDGSETSSECDEDSGIPAVDAGSLSVASLERDAGCGGVRSGSGRRRWDEAEGTSEGDALSISSAASSCAPHHLAHHHDYSKVSPTPPKKPPRRNLSVSPTHANSPSSGYSYELRTHARSQDDLDEIQGAKHYLKHGRSVDQYVDGKLSYSEFEENHNSPRVPPVPNPRPSLKHRSQPVAITAMYENVVIKEQNPRRKLRRNNFGPQNDNEPRMEDRVRKYSNQDRSSLESLLDDQSINSPSDCERYYDGPRIDIPLSPTHYEQPPTPEHPPPSARQAENSIHERIRPLSQLIMEVVEEIRIRKKSQADVLTNS